jgi:hypothetical protein
MQFRCPLWGFNGVNPFGIISNLAKRIYKYVPQVHIPWFAAGDLFHCLGESYIALKKFVHY